MEIISNEQGDTWFLVNGKVLMYMSNQGMLHVKSDVIAYSTDFPPPPAHPPSSDGLKQCTITEMYSNKVRAQ